MTERRSGNLLADLLAEIERSWLDERDATVVDRLTKEHPELSDELSEFFEDLILGPEPATQSSFVEAEERVHSWLQSGGFEIAMNSAVTARETPTAKCESEPERKPRRDRACGGEDTTEPQSKAGTEALVAFLRRRVGKPLTEIAGALEDVTPEYLVLIGRFPKVVPDTVKREIATRIERAWGLRREDTLCQLDEGASFKLAASRSRPFEREPSTFRDLLGRSALSSQQRQFWLKYADESN